MANQETIGSKTNPKTNRATISSAKMDPPKLWLQNPDGASSVLETFRTFRTKLASQTASESRKVFSLTGAQGRVGTSTVAFNLALSFALEMPQDKILVVDANFRRPVLHKVFDIAQRPGLHGLLLNNATIQDVSCPSTSPPGLTLIAAGDTTAKRTAVFPTSAFVAFIQSVKTLYDFIIIDTAPVLQSGQADMIASHSDGTILVVEAGRTRSEVVGAAIDQLNGSGAHLVGSFLNKRKYVIPKWLYPYV